MNTLDLLGDTFRIIAEATPLPTAIFVGSDLVISNANSEMLTVWGKDATVVGKPLSEALPELKDQPFLGLLNNVFTTGEAYYTPEARADHEVGGQLKTAYFTFTYKPLKSIDGSTIAIIATAADVTDLVQARDRLAETQERLTFALNSAELGTWDLDPIRNKVTWDARSRELFFFPQEGEVTYDDVLTRMHPEDEPRVNEAVMLALAPGNGVYDIRYRTQGKQPHELKWVHAKGKAYFREDGQVYRFAGTVEDITDEVAAKRREEQLLSLVENNADNMTIVDTEGNLLYMNLAARKMLGVGVDENLTGINSADFTTAAELARVREEVLFELNNTGAWKGPMQIINRSTKEEIPVYVNYLLIKDPETGEIIGRGANARDLRPELAARKELEETEERLSFALGSAEMGTWNLDLTKNSLACDARCRNVFGFPAEGDILYDDALKYLYAADEPRVTQAMAASLDPELRAPFDIRFRTNKLADGIQTSAHLKGKAYFNEEGKAYRFSGIVQEVTREVMARRREEQLLSLVQHNADHMSIADMEGNLFYMNAAGRAMLGVSAHADITLMRASDFYSPAELERVQQHILQELREQGRWQGTIYLRNTQTKEEIPCHVNYNLIKDPGTGEVIGRGATAHDLRPELAARQELADKNEALEDALQELKFLADAVPSVVWTSTPDGELDYINQRWYEWGATSLEEALGKGWARTVHPEDLETALMAWMEALATGNPYQVEFRLLAKDGAYRWWLVRALSLRDEDGTILKWYGTNTDITEQKELARQKDNFLGVASHELKTPITSIKAYAQVMERQFRKTGDSKNADLVAKMDRQVNKLNTLIGDLLDVTKINTGRLQFTLETFDFNEMVKEVVEDVQHTSAKHEIQTQLNFKRQLTGDRERISQVVTNLLTNAIKYSPDSNEIKVYTQDLTTEVKLCVQDFGIGISPDKKDKVFEQFYRVSGMTQHTFPGLGLGLYISSEIVKRLGGRIWVDSTEGKGSTFCFSLPVGN